MPLTQITQPFARISLPLLARTRDDAALYKKAYLRMVQVILLVTYPGVLYAVIDSDNVIRTVLGERWAGVAPIFGVLGCASFFGTISHTTGWLFISQDRTREMRNWGIFSSALIISSFIAGLHWGPIGVATAYLTVTTVQGPIVWWAVTRKGPVTLKDLVTMLVPFGLSSAVAGTAIFFARYVLPKGIISVIVLLPVTYMLFMAAFFILPAGRKVLVELFENGMMLVGPFMAKFKPRPVQMEDEPL
jgi:PST family polysaccharide transporter